MSDAYYVHRACPNGRPHPRDLFWYGKPSCPYCGSSDVTPHNTRKTER